MSYTIIIIIITCIVSFTAFSNQQLMNNLIFYPPAVTNEKQWYRFISSGLLHADFNHLIFNMISMFMFGRYVEDDFTELFGHNGKFLYLLMYVAALAVSLLPTYFKNRNNSYYRSLGASGAVSAVVFAGLVLRPDITVGFYFIPPIIPGFIFAPAYLIISAYLDRKGGDNINHSAHIWGALFGAAFIIIASKMLADFNAVDNFIMRVKNYIN
jgi:membrane associated rhomboid family serine protease